MDTKKLGYFMDTKKLRYFVAVADAGSFVKASTVLRVAQPALSQQIANLEAELGVTLFERSPRGVVLTAAGQLLIRHAKEILESIRRAQEELARLSSKAANQALTVMPPSLARLISFSLITRLAQEAPEAHLNILDATQDMVRDLFLNGQIVFALMFKPSEVRSVRSIPLVDEPLCLVGLPRGTSPSPTIKLADLDGLPLLFAAYPNRIRERIDAALAPQGVQPRIDSEYNSLPTVLDAIHARGLPTLLPRSLVARAIDEGKLVASTVVEPEIRHLTFVGLSDGIPWRPVDHLTLGALLQVILSTVDSGGWPGGRLSDREALEALMAQSTAVRKQEIRLKS